MREFVLRPNENPMRLFAKCPRCGSTATSESGCVKLFFSEFGHGPICKACYLKEALEAKGMEQVYQRDR